MREGINSLASRALFILICSRTTRVLLQLYGLTPIILLKIENEMLSTRVGGENHPHFLYKNPAFVAKCLFLQVLSNKSYHKYYLM